MVFIQRKYCDLKCWTEFEFWIYEGRQFQLDEPENTNVFRYISKWGFGVYNWKLDDERNSIAWMSVAKVNDVLRYSRAFPRIVVVYRAKQCVNYLKVWDGTVCEIFHKRTTFEKEVCVDF